MQALPHETGDGDIKRATRAPAARGALDADSAVGSGPGLNQRGWEHASAATRLLERRREMFVVQEKLENQKEEFKQQEAEFKKREQKLEEKDLMLQESLLKFSNFLQTKDSERISCAKKAKDEIKMRDQKDVEIRELKEKLKQMRLRRDRVKDELKKHSKYNIVLDGVVEYAKGDYNEIQDVLDRWMTLDTLRQTLEENARSFLQGNEEFKSKLLTLTSEKSGEILEYNNEISSLKNKLEDLMLYSKSLVQLTDRAATLSQTRTLELGKIRMACDNIYERLSSRNSSLKTVPKPDDILEQLRISGNHLEDLIAIVEERKAAEKAAAAAQRSSPHSAEADHHRSMDKSSGPRILTFEVNGAATQMR